MKNIPFFATEAGAASLILDQIAFNKTAYVRIQSSVDLDGLLQDCVAFCRAVGAEHIYAAGDVPKIYESVVTVIRMARPREGLVQSAGRLVPVSVQTLDHFRTIYNEAMLSVENASGLSISKATEILENGSGYLVYDDDLIGLGIVSGEWIHAVVSLKRGMGEFIIKALNQMLVGDKMRVEVSDSNYPAIRLYEKMGFKQYETVSRWYKIFTDVK